MGPWVSPVGPHGRRFSYRKEKLRKIQIANRVGYFWVSIYRGTNIGGPMLLHGVAMAPSGPRGSWFLQVTLAQTSGASWNPFGPCQKLLKPSFLCVLWCSIEKHPKNIAWPHGAYSGGEGNWRGTRPSAPENLLLTKLRFYGGSNARPRHFYILGIVVPIILSFSVNFLFFRHNLAIATFTIGPHAKNKLITVPKISSISLPKFSYC